MFLTPLQTSARQKYSQIPQIVPRGSGLDNIIQRTKQGISVEVLKRLARVQPLLPDALDRASIHHRSGRGAVSVDAVGPGA